ncbi:uncharacterized protein A4U43_C10F16860 [Asparagus officinalis]|uniref:Uncharacterized protein n=1 Tax=Asparagus officinalis TaxID=4686 RepID=A0A5P1E3D1_ASPOF|nr:uncharacterized protein A4U43_C10F16860 [Asparagus officinalis]
MPYPRPLPLLRRLPHLPLGFGIPPPDHPPPPRTGSNLRGRLHAPTLWPKCPSPAKFIPRRPSSLQAASALKSPASARLIPPAPEVPENAPPPGTAPSLAPLTSSYTPCSAHRRALAVENRLTLERGKAYPHVAVGSPSSRPPAPPAPCRFGPRAVSTPRALQPHPIRTGHGLPTIRRQPQGPGLTLTAGERTPRRRQRVEAGRFRKQVKAQRNAARGAATARPCFECRPAGEGGEVARSLAVHSKGGGGGQALRENYFARSRGRGGADTVA